MKKTQRILVGLSCSLMAGLFVAILLPNRASATAIANSNLSSLDNVRAYLKNNNSGYLAYIKGGTILYQPNATAGSWVFANDVTSVTEGPGGDLDCVSVAKQTYAFSATFRSNIGNGCGTDNETSTVYRVGQITINPSDDVPIALWIQDIDSSVSAYQKVAFASTGSIKYVYTPNYEVSYSYSGGVFTNTGSNGTDNQGRCNTGETGNPDRCSAIVLLLGSSYTATVSMKSPRGSMTIKNDIYQDYRTLTFNTNGGTIPGGYLNNHTTTIWEHPSGSNLLREYAYNSYVGYFPIPTKTGYVFKGWTGGPNGTAFRAGDDGVGRFNITSDITLTAQWAPAPPVGAFDSASCGYLTGWSFDQPNFVPSTIHAYFATSSANAVSGGSGAIGFNYGTNWRVARSDVVNAYGSPPLSYSQNYGFQIPIAEQFVNNQVWYVGLYAIGGNSNGNVYLGQRSFGPCNWTLTPSTTSSVNSTSAYNNSDKTAYPSHAAFGGHSSKTSDDAVYYKTTVTRSNDGILAAATFSYRPFWVFLENNNPSTNRNVNNGTADISNMCVGSTWTYDSWFYQAVYKRCLKYIHNLDASVASNSSVDIPATDDLRLWSNSLVNTNPINPAPTNASLPLRTVIGKRACYYQEFSRLALSQGAGSIDEGVSHSTGGAGDWPTNGCQISVAYPWILEPKVNNLPSQALTGDTYSVTPIVASSESNVAGTTHTAQLVRVIGPGNWVPKQGLNVMGNDTSLDCTAGPSYPCTKYNDASSPAGAESAAVISQASNLSDAAFAAGTWTGSAINETFQEAWYGKKVCYYTVTTTGGWAYDKTGEVRFSNPQCVTWVKSPQVQIRGADASSGGIWDGTTNSYDGGFESTLSTDAGRGSWSQYGLSTYTGSITSFGSAGYTINSDKTKACKLVFANYINNGSVVCSVTGTGGRLFEGSALTQTISLPKEAKYDTNYINSQLDHVVGGDGVHINLNSLASGTYRIVPNTHIDLTLMPVSRQITLVSTGIIYIDGNIRTADSSFSSLSDVPVLTVISMKEIAVSKNVDRIYGTYIAAGDGSDSSGNAFVTCYDSSDLKDGGGCSRQLRVDGAVITQTSPVLHRTIGAGYSSSSTTHTITANLETHLDATTAAELFNYQPTMFLTPYALAHGDNTGSNEQSLVVTNQSILPARF